MPAPRTISAPSLQLLATEPVRAAVEFARMCLMRRGDLPRGEQHPVVIFPGLATDHHSTAPLARHCAALGYTTYDWGRGLNRGPEGDPDVWLDGLAHEVGELIRHEQAPATLIGWSLGGIYAREMAKRLPRIRQVITIGSPVSGDPQHTNVGWLYQWMSGQRTVIDSALARRLRAAPPTPTTSIYSRRDGVVAWQACRLPRSPIAENIEVASSHLGLVWHPEVLAIIADRLAQPAGQWQPWSMTQKAREVARAA